MTKRRQKYNKRTRKRIRQTKITRGQIKRTFKKTSRARGWLDKILGKPPTQINLDVLMQNFTDCDWNVKYNCNSLKTELMKRLTEMKKNEIKEIKKDHIFPYVIKEYIKHNYKKRRASLGMLQGNENDHSQPSRYSFSAVSFAWRMAA